MAIRLDHSRLSRISLFALVLASSGCATVFHGTRQRVEIFTEPAGASATADGQSVMTPGVLVLPRKAKNLEIRIEKEGYTPKTVTLRRETSGAVWWNFMGIATGAAAGAAFGDSTSGSTQGIGPNTAGASGAVIGGAVAPAIGFATDYSNGAAYRQSPATVVVKLTPNTVAAVSEKEKETP